MQEVAGLLAEAQLSLVWNIEEDNDGAQQRYGAANDHEVHLAVIVIHIEARVSMARRRKTAVKQKLSPGSFGYVYIENRLLGQPKDTFLSGSIRKTNPYVVLSKPIEN